MARLRLTFEDLRDSLAEKLLPFLEILINYLFEKGIPALDGFIAGLSGENSVTAGITEATEGAFKFGEQIRSTIEFVISIKDELIILGQIIATVFVASKIAAFVTEIKVLTGAMVALNTAATGAAIATAAATKIGLGVVGAGLVGLAAVGNQAFTPSLPGGAVSTRGNPGQTIINNNISVSAIDGEGAARAVANTLSSQAERSRTALRRAAISNR
jgi:hypothetical protein